MNTYRTLAIFTHPDDEYTFSGLIRISILIIVLILLSTVILGCNTKEISELNKDAYEDLLGITKQKIISLFGEKYVITTQGANNQYIGLEYNDCGIIFGIDEITEKVVEIQILNGEYLGISTEMNIDEAVQVLNDTNTEVLTINLNNIGTWYIYNFGDYRVRLSEANKIDRRVQIFITLDDYK